MRKTVLLVILLLCAAGVALAVNAPPAPVALSAGQVSQATDYHPRVSPAIAALQAQAQAALARGDVAAARELERQVQAQLIEEQHVVSHPVQPVGAKPSGGARGSFESDKLIAPGSPYAISADYEQDPDGTMWVAIAMQADSNTWIYKSTDHGASWDTVASLHWTPLHPIGKIKLVVGQGDSGLVYVFEIVPSNDGDLMVGRVDKDGSGLTGWGIRTGADTITDFTACRDFMGDGYWLYATTYNGARPGDALPASILRSTDYGHTWATTDSIHNARRPTLVFGAVSWGYLSVVPAPHLFQGAIPIGVTNSWASPGTWTFSQWQPDTFPINDAAIASAFTAPESTATVWLAYTHNNNGTDDYDVFSAHTNDARNGGWAGPDTIANTGNPEGYVDLKHYTSPGNTHVNVSYVNMDITNHYSNVYLGWADASTPEVWHMGGPINQSVYSGWGFTTYPNIVYSPNGPSSGGGVVFADCNSSGTYFNAPWLTGVAEQPGVAGRGASILGVTPSIARGAVRVRWDGSATRLTVTDALGRIVRDYAHPAGQYLVWDGKVAAGTYFMHLVTNQGSATRPIVIQ